MANKIKVEKITKEIKEDPIVRDVDNQKKPISEPSEPSEPTEAKEPVKEKPKVSMEEDRKIDRGWENKAEIMRKNFESQPTVEIMIPCEGEEQPGVVKTEIVNGKEVTIAVSGAVWSKTFNGHRVIIPKGVYTPVAKQVADNIAKEFAQTQSAGEQWKIDRKDPNTGGTVKQQLS